MSKLKWSIFVLLITVFAGFTQPNSINAQTTAPDTLQVRVDQIVEQKEVTFNEFNQMETPSSDCYQAGPDICRIQTYQKISATVITGDHKGETVLVVSGDSPSNNANTYQPGDELVIQSSGDTNPNDDIPDYYVSDYRRVNQIFILFICFLVVAFVVTRFKGMKAILGMFYSFIIIVNITIPMIIAGHSPFLVALLSIVLILPPTFYFSHGINRKSNAAMLGTAISMLITIFIAYLAIKGVRLTGYGNEESSFIQAIMGDKINIQGLLLAGVMITALGTLNDVTVSQAAVVAELKKSNPDLKFKEIYQKAMNVGRDHVVSMVDTLVLVYAGGSLPLLILLADSSRSFLEVMNFEMVAEEIINMLVGSIGLILAVPITTMLATAFFDET